MDRMRVILIFGMPFTASCQDTPLLTVGRNSILVRGLGRHDSPSMIYTFFLKVPLLAAGMFTNFSVLLTDCSV